MRRRYVLLWKDGDAIKGHSSALHLAMCCCIIWVSKMFYHPSWSGEWMAHSWTSEQSYIFFHCGNGTTVLAKFHRSCWLFDFHNLHYFQPNGILGGNISRSGLCPSIKIITFQNLNRNRLDLKFGICWGKKVAKKKVRLKWAKSHRNCRERNFEKIHWANIILYLFSWDGRQFW